MSLNELTISEAREKLRSKEIKATELTEACAAAIKAGNEALNAFVVVTADRALDAAKESDKRLGAKSQSGVRPLEGIPLGIKDLFCTKGVRTAAGSHILGNFVPTYKSTVTQNLWDAGAVMLGKLNMDEFAMGSSTETSYFGPCVNPWRANGSQERLVPGGSSGGSAAAVAAGLCLGATASDTGGSIRQPGSVHRHGRHQADLWPLLTLGHGGFRLLARSGRPDGALHQGPRVDASGHGEPRSEELHQRDSANAGPGAGARPVCEGA